MDNYKLLVDGGIPLKGETYVSGGKNTSVAIIPATLLCDGPCVLENIPDIEDVRVLVGILRYLGAEVDFDKTAKRLCVDPTHVTNKPIPGYMTGHLRASYYLWGALLGRFGECDVGYPGGCTIGSRPYDQHIKGFEALGASVIDRGDGLFMQGDLAGAPFYFQRITVGGTINIMLAAARARGTTILHNAAREPHIVDLANFLNSMGAVVKGAGTDTIRIRGVSSLHSSDYAIIPDQIETGTLMIAAAATRGDVVIRGCIPTHMEALSAKLLEMGISVQEQDDAIHVRPPVRFHRPVDIRTQEYPGFPTDLQQPMSAMLCLAGGRSVITETIFENRFLHLREMLKMGAHVDLDEANRFVAVIQGVSELHGATVTATDLRAGAALVIAGLIAKGTTEIREPGFIERGYEHIEEKLRSLGANIRREGL